LEIWTAFARRGMGLSAYDGGSSDSTNVTEAFDMPDLGLKVAGSTPGSGSVVAAPATDFAIDFSAAYLSSSVQVEDLVVNGRAADSLTLTDADTVTFHYATSPVTDQGLQTMSIAAGAILRASDDGPIEAWSASFRYDAHVMGVTSTDPANGSNVTLPFTQIEVSFDEAVGADSIGVADLTLTQGSVVSATIVDADTVRYPLSGINSEGVLGVSLAAGAVTDTWGNPGTAYSGSYSLDFGTVAFPTPLTAVNPLGGMIYTGSATGALASGSDTDSFTIALDAGQTLTALVEPAAGLRPTVSIAGPGGMSAGPADAPAPGAKALLQAAPTLAPGTYTVTVGSIGVTTGAFTLRLTLNAALEAEEQGGATNDTLATAQDISASFVPLGDGAGQRGAVVGTLPSATGQVVASENFDSGTLGPQWTTYRSNTTYGRIQLTGSYGTAAGACALLMDVSSSGNNLNEAIWTVDLAGVPSPTLSFYHRSFGDETTNFSGDFTGHYNADGVAISADGTTWHPVWNGTSVSTWTQYTIDLAAQAATHGIALGSNFKVKFQQYDNLPLSSDGRGYDEITITTPAPTEDWYRFALDAGQSATLALGASAAGATVALYDGSGTLRATGTAAYNLSSVIRDFVAPAAGLYYARVTGVSVNYSLVVTKDAAFDTESNDSVATAQTLPVVLNEAVALGYCSLVLPGGRSVEPDNYAAGTALTNVVPGVTLTCQGSTDTITSQTASYCSTGTRVFAHGSTTTFSDSIFLRASFASPVSGVSIDLVPDDTNDPGFLKAYNSDGTLLQDLQTAAPPYPGFLTMTITRPTADIAYVVAGGQSGQAVYLDHLVASGTDLGDYYKISVNAGESLVVATATPGDGAGQFDNTLDPRIEVYDPSGALIASDSNSGPDGRNAALSCAAATGGDYVIRVLSEADSQGEYLLSAKISQLTITVPSDATEGAGTVNGTLNLPAALDHDVTVNLASSNPSRATVPPTVTIPAGETAWDLPITIVDNGLLDGPEAVVITAMTVASADSGTITVHDDETATLTVSLPASATEGDGTLIDAGTITASAAPTRDIVVALSSSDTGEVIVPATVILHAGQTTATFDVTIVDDTRIDNAQTVTVTAHVENWTDGAAGVTVLDNDGTLAVTLPADVWEGQGTRPGAGTVQIGGTLPDDLTISLISDDTTELDVPATVTIPAGQTSATFDVIVVDDADHDGAQTATVTAGAAGLPDATRPIVVRDNELDRFAWDSISTPQTAGVAFLATVRATNVDDETILVYDQTVALSAAGSGGSQPVTPPSCAFFAGVWTGNVTVGAVDTGVALTVDDGAGHTGVSNTFDVVHGPLDHFEWSTIASPQYENAPIAVVVTAMDAHGFTVTDYSGEVTLGGLVSTGTSSSIVISEVTVGTPDAIELTNVSGTSIDIGGWKVLVYDTAHPSTPMLALAVPAGTICPAGGVFVVEELGAGPGAYPHYYTDQNVSWTPFAATGVLLLDSAGNARDFMAASALDPTTVTDPTTIVPSQWQGAQVAAVGSDAYSYQRVGNNDTSTAADWLTNRAPGLGTLNTGLTAPFVGRGLAMAPTTASLVAGVWSGAVTVLQTATGAYFHLDDGAGKVRDSNAFNVLPPTLFVTVPADATEGDGVLTGTIAIPAALAGDLVVHVVSGDPARVSAPGVVTIPAGQTSAELLITILDNALLDGPEPVAITATAVDYAGGAGTITVHDDETATLTVSVPLSATEGDGVLVGAGTLASRAAPTRDIVVSLAFSDASEVTVPATVVLRAGQTTATFDVTILDDTLIDDAQTVTVTAHVENWTDDAANVTVLDNDRTLAVTLPADVWEGQGTRTGVGTVRIGGTLPDDLTISLISDDATELDVPATVTIPAGQTSATFDMTVVDDADADGVQTATVTAGTTGFSDATGTVAVHDNEVDHYVWDAIDGPNVAGVAFWTTARARNVDDETIVVYDAAASLSAAGDSGAAPVAPAACTFTAGVWSGNVTVIAVDTNVTLTLDDGAGHTGTSNTFDLTHGPLDHFQWSTIASPQYKDVPFNVTLTAVDAHGFTVKNFDDTVDLSGWSGQTAESHTIFANPTHAGSGSGNYSFGYTFTPNVNILVTHACHYFGSKVSLWTDTGTLLGSVSYTSTAGTWTETPLATPIQLQAGTAYRVGVYTGGSNYSYYLRQDMGNTFPDGIINQAYYGNGDVFPTTADTVARYQLVSLRYDVGSLTSVAITPTTATFAGGIWTGDVSVLATAASMYLRVDDGAGHVVNSDTFDVTMLTLTTSPPADATEGAGTVNGTVQIPTALDHDLVVSLASGNPLRATVPSTVTIPAGQTSVELPITIIDNDLLDGPDAVLITATTAFSSPSTATIMVHDNETSALAVTVPASATEGAGVLVGAGTVTSIAAPARDMVVSLVSSDTTEITVPATVVLRAGQTSATFDVTIVNDTVIDGGQIATITAHVENWTDGATNMVVFDNDRTLAVTLPTDAWEGQGMLAGAGTVQIGGTLTTDLVVSLASDDTGEVLVPATVTIPAGQTWATFDVTVVDDADRDGAQTATVTASAAGFPNATGLTVVHDDELDHFAWDAVAGPKTAAVAFSATARAKNIDNETIHVYSGAAALGASGDSGSLPLSPSSCAFAAGGWTGSVTVGAVDTNVVLTADDGAGHTGASNTFEVTHGPLDHFQWSTISSPQYENLPFEVTLTALDAHGFTVTSFNDTVNLSGWVGEAVSHTIFANPTPTSSFSGDYTLGYAFTPNTDIVVTHLCHYFGKKASLWTDAGTLLASVSYTDTPGAWVETALVTPVQLHAGTKYRIGA